jgi:5-methylcytosine-specific restriction endonuclease McrA
MSATQKVQRWLITLVVVAILAVLVWRFGSGTDYLFISGLAAVIIAIVIIYFLFRSRPVRHTADRPRPAWSELVEKMKRESGDSEQSDSETGHTHQNTTNVIEKPQATDVVARYFEMSKTGYQKPEFGSSQDEEHDPEADTVAADEKPPALITDVSSLTIDEKNELANAVWYHCENPYCKFSRLLEVHHIVDEKDGGTNKLDNLIVLCPYCHDLAHRHEIPEKEMHKWISRREHALKFEPNWRY